MNCNNFTRDISLYYSVKIIYLGCYSCDLLVREIKSCQQAYKSHEILLINVSLYHSVETIYLGYYS